MEDEHDRRSRRSRKKSRSKDEDIDVDADFVDKQMRMAAKQMERAMGQMKLAKKTAAMASQIGTQADELHRQKDDGTNKMKGVVIDHYGHHICIESAENIQVGSNNTMIITGKKKKSSRRRKSYGSDEEDIVEKPADRHQKRQEEQAVENERHVEEVLRSERIVTTEDLKLAAGNVGSDWRRLMRFLGLDDALISELHQEFYVEGIREVVTQGFLRWKQQADKEATLGKLTSTLKRVGYGGIVQSFKL